ncbi:ABC transporter ATP-binding protein [Cohnella massiliensis]|mgnify:CR=1 FL=1|uniref:ABC transporter ATP-binding protein n=1 Tax=Cohnella massiliensis TaxID=1816691 RepID=UPI0009BBD4E5|nr:ABC transporter ATP-binding protein [Cohnella massiliensis]
MIALTETEPAVRLRGATVRNEGFALGPLDIDIPKGLVTAIVGPNGSGKSTLFRLLMNMEPFRGEGWLLGEPLAEGSDEELKKQIGFLAELPHAYEDPLTPEEKAKFAANWYPGWDWGRYGKLLRSFDAEPVRGKLRKLSKGMRRKVELACAMAHNPKLLLLDEPSSGLDPFAWKSMLTELHRYMEQGDRTLVIATHITEEVRRLADYILFMYRGKVLGSFEKDQLFDEWRQLLVQLPEAARGDSDWLRRLPGLRGQEASGGGIFRIESDRSEEAQAYCRERGCTILSVQRMELEDILGCLIREEEQKR